MSGGLKALLSRPVAFHPVLARVCGSVAAGLMLSQALYWTERTRNEEGWFYKTQDEWTDEICLTRSEQETARSILRSLNLVQEERRGMPAKLHYRVDVDAVMESVSQYAGKPQSSKRKTSNQVRRNHTNSETSPLECVKPANMSAEIPQPLYGTETTQKLPETRTTSTASVGLESLPVLKASLKWLPSVDQELVDRLVKGCFDAAPDAAIEDVVYFVNQKGPTLYTERPTADGSRLEPRSDIRSPGGFLLTAVVKCFQGAAYRDYRNWADRHNGGAA